MGDQSEPVALPPPPRRRYAIEWDEPGAGFVVDLFDDGKPVINISVNTDWTEEWHPEVNPAGLQALHAIIDTADPARLARAEARVAELEGLIDALADAIVASVPGEPSQSEGAIETAIRLLTGGGS